MLCVPQGNAQALASGSGCAQYSQAVVIERDVQLLQDLRRILLSLSRAASTQSIGKASFCDCAWQILFLSYWLPKGLSRWEMVLCRLACCRLKKESPAAKPAEDPKKGDVRAKGVQDLAELLGPHAQHPDRAGHQPKLCKIKRTRLNQAYQIPNIARLADISPAWASLIRPTFEEVTCAILLIKYSHR